MKKLLFIAIIYCMALFSSCFSAKSYIESSIIDYSRYMRNGFFITESNSVNFSYVPIGSVRTVYVKNLQARENITVYDIINTFVADSQEKGANGVINFHVDYTFDKNHQIIGIIISGMAIEHLAK